MRISKPPLMSRRLLLFMGTMILANIAGHMHQVLMPLFLQELGAGVNNAMHKESICKRSMPL